MKRTSLDGRPLKVCKTWTRRTDTSTANLRPSSPPKKNPWLRSEAVAIKEFLGLPALEPRSRCTDMTAAKAPQIVESQTSSESCTPLTIEAECYSEAGKSPDTVATSISTSPSKFRKMLEAAAPRASENLWKFPFGADVHIHVESIVFRVHRSVITQQSAWFRDFLPPPNEDGTHVDVFLPYSVGAAGTCLMFLYTNKIDIYKEDKLDPLNNIHIPRCVLGYCAALSLRIEKLTSHILEIVERSAANLGEFLDTHYIERVMDRSDSIVFLFNLLSALNIIHDEPCSRLMKPMRLALAGVLHACLPSLLLQPVFIELLSLPDWQRHSSAIAADQVEYRKRLRLSRSLKRDQGMAFDDPQHKDFSVGLETEGREAWREEQEER